MVFPQAIKDKNSIMITVQLKRWTALLMVINNFSSTSPLLALFLICSFVRVKEFLDNNNYFVLAIFKKTCCWKVNFGIISSLLCQKLFINSDTSEDDYNNDDNIAGNICEKNLTRAKISYNNIILSSTFYIRLNIMHVHC